MSSGLWLTTGNVYVNATGIKKASGVCWIIDERANHPAQVKI
jgi:hypothetical protein